MKNLIIVFIIALIMQGCNDNVDNSGGGSSQPQGNIIVNPSGFAETGPYQGYSEVIMCPLDGDYSQIGNPCIGDTRADDSGRFTVYGKFDEGDTPFVKTKINGQAYNETSNSFDNGVITESTNPVSVTFNVNYITSIVSIVGNYWYHEDVGGPHYHKPTAFEVAETVVLDYFDYSDSWGAQAKKSYEMTLTGDTLDDAKLVLVNSTIVSGKVGWEQNRFMRQIAEDIYSGANALKASVNNITANLKLKTIRDNLDNYYLDRSLSFDCAPIWMLPGIPDYYTDLMSREATVLDSKNIDYYTSGAVDIYDMHIFAYPLELISDNQRYIALNLSGTLSIWTVKTCIDGYSCPDTKVADMTLLNEVLLDNPVALQYNYKFSETTGPGQYFIRQEFESNTSPSKLTTGDMAPFGRNMASSDGVTWLGWNNTTNWYRRSVKFVSYD